MLEPKWKSDRDTALYWLASRRILLLEYPAANLKNMNTKHKIKWHLQNITTANRNYAIFIYSMYIYSIMVMQYTKAILTPGTTNTETDEK